MFRHPAGFVLSLLMVLSLSASCPAEQLPQSAEPPMIPVGLDAYRQWDRLPYQRIGIRGYMRSTYDRTGGNLAADASHYLYAQPGEVTDMWSVSLDEVGPGCLYFKRTNHWHGSPWNYEIDGTKQIVTDTATDNPVGAKQRLEKTTFNPEELFPNPLTWTWSTTHGANLMWVPLMFENSLRIQYGRTHYGTGYYIYHRFAAADMKNISRPIRSWDRNPPSEDVLDLLRKAGTDVAPQGPGVTAKSGKIDLNPRETKTIAMLEGKPQVVRALKLRVPRDAAIDFGNCRLRVTWDDRYHASIDAPVDLFFGAGTLYNRENHEYLVKGLPMVIRFDETHCNLECYFPMPLFRSAKFELEEQNGKPLAGVEFEIRTVPYTDPINHAAYFHATYSDHPDPTLGQDIEFLDTYRAEGGGKLWSGNFVGMSWIFAQDTKPQFARTLEGDPRILLDDSNTPQGWATGTEEWGGGGDYWGGRNMTIPLAGHPTGFNPNRKGATPKDPEDMIQSAYRFLVADHFPFGRRAVMRLEHGGDNSHPNHYEGVAYWYGIDSPTLNLTDHFFACADNEIKEHAYESPNSGEPYTLVSRYEWGVDSRQARMYFPAQEDQARTMTGTSSFKMKLDPRNLGVMLRRKFDFGVPNQKAKVSVKPDAPGKDWKLVGVWYTAGSNTSVYSYADDELGKFKPVVRTGNRRWREEEFLIPRELTEGVERLCVKLEHVPIDRELWPGTPFPIKNGWSESRYWAYCYQMPEVILKTPEDNGAKE